MRAAVGLTISLLKLRIGVAIAASALAGIAVANGPGLAWWQIVGLALAILGASGAAGAFNHYYERDVDRLMRRTRARPFASGTFRPSPWWLAGFLGLLAASLGLASVTAGNVATFRLIQRRDVPLNPDIGTSHYALGSAFERTCRRLFQFRLRVLDVQLLHCVCRLQPSGLFVQRGGVLDSCLAEQQDQTVGVLDLRDR